MTVERCKSCSADLPDGALYCPGCAQQVRCTACRNLIEPAWQACITCGTRISELTNDQIIKETPTDPQAVNTIEYHETPRSRSLRANFTNTIGKSLSNALTRVLSNRFEPTRVKKIRSPVIDAEIEDPQQPLFPMEIPQPPNTPSGPPALETQEAPSLGNQTQQDLATLERIFRSDGDSLKLVDRRLRNSTQIDFARRLACLFLYFNELKGKEKVVRTTLTTILTENDAFDRHTRAWLSNNPNEIVSYGETEGETVGLSNEGREFAIKVLSEIRNPSEQPRRKPGKTVSNSKKKVKTSTPINERATADKKRPQRRADGRPSPRTVLDDLIKQDFFKEKKTISAIISHCKDKLTYSYESRELSPALIRCIRDEKLKREKNTNNQYEYQQ